MSSRQIKDRCILNSFIGGGGIVVDRFWNLIQGLYMAVRCLCYFAYNVVVLRARIFNGVAKHGSRHIAITGVEESTEPDFIFFPDLSQHPAYGFAD